MGKKEFGANSKKEEAKDRKDLSKKEKVDKEEKVKEDSKWADGDKKVAKKLEKDVRGCYCLERRER